MYLDELLEYSTLDHLSHVQSPSSLVEINGSFDIVT